MKQKCTISFWLASASSIFVSEGSMSYHSCTFGLKEKGLIQKSEGNWDEGVSFLGLVIFGWTSVSPKNFHWEKKNQSCWLDYFLPHNVAQKFLSPLTNPPKLCWFSWFFGLQKEIQSSKYGSFIITWWITYHEEVMWFTPSPKPLKETVCG